VSVVFGAEGRNGERERFGRLEGVSASSEKMDFVRILKASKYAAYRGEFSFSHFLTRVISIYTPPLYKNLSD